VKDADTYPVDAGIGSVGGDRVGLHSRADLQGAQAREGLPGRAQGELSRSGPSGPPSTVNEDGFGYGARLSHARIFLSRLHRVHSRLFAAMQGEQSRKDAEPTVGNAASLVG